MTDFLVLFFGMAVVVFVLGLCIFFVRCVRKVEQGNALIINKLNKLDVKFTGGIVLPIIHKAEIMDISVKTIDIERSGTEGLICRDYIRADIKVTFFVRVSPTVEDVVNVAKSIGCKRASSKETLDTLFQAKFSEALKTVGKRLDFNELFTERQRFKEHIIEVIGDELNGYKLEDAAIDFLEQTPLESMNTNDVNDAQGITKITQVTAEQHKKTNAERRDKEKVIKQQDVETRETILNLERDQSKAEAEQKRDIETIQAEQAAEAEKIKAEQRLKYERARIKADEEIAIAEEDKERQVQIAAKNKEKAIAVEEERVLQAQELEATERERVVTLKQYEKEKQIEQEKKEIQDIIRERVAVERTVTEEQEKIKDTVADATALREKRVQVTKAEEVAEARAINVTVEARARKEAAEHSLEEKTTLAEAEKVTMERQADGKKAFAEGTIAEEAALGLANVKVKEAEANAIEMTGRAEANAAIEKHKAQAFGMEATGEADAKATTAKHKAQAFGIEATGLSEARSMEAKFTAEAEGINKKADAMKKFDAVGKEHEEFKLNLGKDERIQLAEIDVERQVAEYQSKVMAEAVKSAKIDIMGGGEEFLRTFFKSITMAKSIDGFVEHSEVAQNALTDGGIVDKLKELVRSEGLGTEDIKNLTVSALLAKLALKGSSSESRTAAASLKGAVSKLGLDDAMAMWLAK